MNLKPNFNQQNAKAFSCRLRQSAWVCGKKIVFKPDKEDFQ